MKRFKLMGLLAVALVLWSTGWAFSDKPRTIQLTPVADSPRPKASGALANVQYDTYMEYGEYGEPLGKYGACAVEFQFSGLAPNTWYNLRGIMISWTGAPMDFVFYSPTYDYEITFYTDDFGDARGVAHVWYLPPRKKFDYFELWTGNYGRDDRSQMVLVLSSE